MPTKKSLANSSTGGTSMLPNKSLNKSDKESDNVYFSLAVVAIVILIVIGIIFGYTKDKINKLNQAQEETKTLASQLQDVSSKLASLQDKTNTLESLNKENQALVVDILEKQREIPANVDTKTWTVYKDPSGAYQIKFPKTWELAKPLIGPVSNENSAKEAAETDKAKTDIQADSEKNPPSSITYFQPKAMPAFAQAVSIQEDYLDFASMSIKEKYAIFKDLKLIDEFDFDSGRGLYFLNLNDKGEQVPTVLFLTKKHIYRMTFNVLDKQTIGYLTYRGDFEKSTSTFTTVLNK